MHRWENFDKALDWIYSFTNLERDRDKRKDKESFQLLPIKKMDQFFGNPSAKLKIIHVAGSKGKGTVSYLLSKYFTNIGFKVGLYISPHILNVRERIQINGNLINEEEFITILLKIADYVDSIDDKNEIPTFFDIFTELAFLYFCDKKVDLAILEVGLGGRLDSTNIVKPLTSVITSITLEHTEVLGNALREIAGEKAGIIKPNVPVVLSKNRLKVLQRVTEEAVRKNSKIYYCENFVKVKERSFLKRDENIYCNYKIDLLKEKESFYVISKLIGSFQDENIATAILTCIVSGKLLNKQFEKEIFIKTLEDARWNFRFEIKFYLNRTIIIDGAHTQDSIKKLINTIKILIKQKLISEEIGVVIGMMKDKNHKGILNNLLKISSCFYFVELDKWKDSKVLNYLGVFKDLLKNEKKQKVKYYIQDDIQWKGSEIIEKLVKENKTIKTIIVTGSLYLAQYFTDL